MDTNYLISVIQQNTETIKQLKTEVEVLKNNLDEVISSLSNESEHMTEYAKRMTYTSAHYPTNDNNDNKSVSFANLNKYKKITNYELKFGKIRLPMFTTIKKDQVNNVSQQLFNEIKQHAPYKTITALSICDELYSTKINELKDHCHWFDQTIITSYRHNFDIDFLTYFPNLEILNISGYGLCGLLNCLTNSKHKLSEINLHDYYTSSTFDKSNKINEINDIKEYCKTNNIKFSLKYSRERVIYRDFDCNVCVGSTHVHSVLHVEIIE